MKEERTFSDQAVGIARQAYINPVLSKIRLVVEEAVLAYYKWSTGLGVRKFCLAAGEINCTANARR